MATTEGTNLDGQGDGPPLPGRSTERMEAELLAARRLLIDEREHAENADRHAAELAALIDHLQAGVIVCDETGELRIINEAAHKLFGISVTSEAPSRLGIAFESPDGHALPAEQSPFAPPADDTDDRARGEVVLRRPDGKRRTLVVGRSVIRDRGGSVISTIAVFYDVTDLREAERLRQEYIALLSHDLRSPLTAIRLSADLLAHQLAARDLPQEAHVAERIRHNARRMSTMIADLVDSSQLEAGKLPLRRSPVELGAFLTQICERASPFEDGRVTVESRLGGATIDIDADRMERAVVNLLTNALKYSPPPSPIVVRGWIDGGDVVVTVSDNGPGIAQADRRRIFDKYVRVSTATKAEGTGLGLYITRLILEAHGGRVWVESELGQGSTFGFRLPLEAQPSAGGEACPTPSQTRPRVLIVEDEADVREIVSQVLEARGYAVETAVDGLAAIAHLQKTTRDPCIVLLDLMMPHLNGWELMELLRKEDRLYCLPVVVMSASGDDVPDGVRFLRKPFALEELVRVVTEHCGPAPNPR
jgi:two-component system, NtrC family, sensor histidine kinase KinB